MTEEKDSFAVFPFLWRYRLTLVAVVVTMCICLSDSEPPPPPNSYTESGNYTKLIYKGEVYYRVGSSEDGADDWIEENGRPLQWRYPDGWVPRGIDLSAAIKIIEAKKAFEKVERE